MCGARPFSFWEKEFSRQYSILSAWLGFGGFFARWVGTVSARGANRLRSQTSRLPLKHFNRPPVFVLKLAGIQGLMAESFQFSCPGNEFRNPWHPQETHFLACPFTSGIWLGSPAINGDAGQSQGRLRSAYRSKKPQPIYAPTTGVWRSLLSCSRLESQPTVTRAHLLVNDDRCFSGRTVFMPRAVDIALWGYCWKVGIIVPIRGSETSPFAPAGHSFSDGWAFATSRETFPIKNPQRAAAGWDREAVGCKRCQVSR